MHKTALLFALSFLWSACAGSPTIPGPTTTAYSPPDIPMSAQTWVSIDIGPDVSPTLSSELLTRHVVELLSRYETQILGVGTPESSQPESGCKEPDCFGHLRNSMSVHRVVRVAVTTQQESWNTELQVLDLAYGKVLAAVSKTVTGDEEELLSTLDDMVDSAYPTN